MKPKDYIQQSTKNASTPNAAALLFCEFLIQAALFVNIGFSKFLYTHFQVCFIGIQLFSEMCTPCMVCLIMCPWRPTRFHSIPFLYLKENYYMLLRVCPSRSFPTAYCYSYLHVLLYLSYVWMERGSSLFVGVKVGLILKLRDSNTVSYSTYYQLFFVFGRCSTVF